VLSNSPQPPNEDWVERFISFLQALLRSIDQWWRDVGRSIFDNTLGKIENWKGWNSIHEAVRIAVEWVVTVFQAAVHFSELSQQMQRIWNELTGITYSLGDLCDRAPLLDILCTICCFTWARDGALSLFCHCSLDNSAIGVFYLASLVTFAMPRWVRNPW
jgi:hypothetical protein